MTAAQSVTPGPANMPQLNAVNSGTMAVSLQIGGDNLGFTSIIENCAALTPWGPTKVGANCKNYYDPHGNDSLLAAINALAPTVGGVLAQIARRHRQPGSSSSATRPSCLRTVPAGPRCPLRPATRFT